MRILPGTDCTPPAFALFSPFFCYYLSSPHPSLLLLPTTGDLPCSIVLPIPHPLRFLPPLPFPLTPTTPPPTLPYPTTTTFPTMPCWVYFTILCPPSPGAGRSRQAWWWGQHCPPPSTHGYLFPTPFPPVFCITITRSLPLPCPKTAILPRPSPSPFPYVLLTFHRLLVFPHVTGSPSGLGQDLFFPREATTGVAAV